MYLMVVDLLLDVADVARLNTVEVEMELRATQNFRASSRDSRLTKRIDGDFSEVWISLNAATSEAVAGPKHFGDGMAMTLCEGKARRHIIRRISKGSLGNRGNVVGGSTLVIVAISI